MTSSEIIEAVMEAAAEATETGTNAITSKSRIRETVDARHMAIKTMYDLGVYVPRTQFDAYAGRDRQYRGVNVRKSVFAVVCERNALNANSGNLKLFELWCGWQ